MSNNLERFIQAFSQAGEDGLSVTLSAQEVSDIADVLEHLKSHLSMIYDALPPAGDSHGLHRAYNAIEAAQEPYGGVDVMEKLTTEQDRLWEEIYRRPEYVAYKVEQNGFKKRDMLRAIKAKIIADRAEMADLTKRAEATAVVVAYLMEQKFNKDETIAKDTALGDLRDSAGKALTFGEAAAQVTHFATIPKWKDAQI